jgi:hypothetical protein
MIIHIGPHAISTTADARYRTYYRSAWWVGDYTTIQGAKQALTEATVGNIKGCYAGAPGMTDDEVLEIIGNDISRAIAAQKGFSSVDGIRWMCPVGSDLIAEIDRRATP